MTLSYIPSDTNDEGILKATASGVLPNGKPVIVNSDGTVSVVAETSVTEGFGSSVVFESAASYYNSVVFDASQNKIVIAYRDGGNSNYGTAIVGTVSGDTISFGTPIVFESALSYYISATFDSNSDKVIVAYVDNGNADSGTAVVGTVSGTSVSFGSPVVFNSGATDYTATVFDTSQNKVVISYRDKGNSNHGTAIVGTVSGTSISFGAETSFNTSNSSYIAAAFDSSSNKVVVSYADQGNSAYGTAIVGTVSGTSISFGTEAVFESGTTTFHGCVFDSTSNKIVFAYKDASNSSYGTAIVGTVSGTSISFGSAVVFQASNTNEIACSFDSTASKVLISYRDFGNSSHGTSIVGTVSGTSISFGSAVVFEAATTNYIASAYDSNSSAIVLAYTDAGNSEHGTAIVFRNAGSFTNLTSENYIGISTGGTYADGSNATVKIIGNTSDEQSGLTAGQAYYVQTDGTLGTTPATPSVFAGTALSATKMIVKT